MGAAATRRDWAALLALALALRLVAAWQESVLHPDEVFQYLEGAFRLLHGYSVQTWEYRDGMRAALFPALLAAPMRIGEWIAPDGRLPILLPRMAMATASLTIVAAAGWMGARISRRHFWAAGLVAALWIDLVAFAPHPLTEQLAALLTVPAIALLAKRDWSARVLVGIGFALGMAFLFRPHVAPAIGLTMLCYLWSLRFRGFVPLLGGALLALAVGAGSDMLAGDTPFAWMVNNFTRNIIDNVSARYGVSGPFQYLADLWAIWSLWSLPILALAAVGARRYPLLAVLAIANVAVHSAIGHKEYRFIILSVSAVILLAGIGTGEAIAWWSRRGQRPAALAAALALAGWLAAWAQVAPVYQRYGTRTVTPFTAASFDAFRGRADLCGVAIVGGDFYRVYGYARLRRDVPILIRRGDGDPAIDPAQFNSALVWTGREAMLSPAFRREHCSPDGRQCRYTRPGGCSGAASASAINRYLADRGM